MADYQQAAIDAYQYLDRIYRSNNRDIDRTIAESTIEIGDVSNNIAFEDAATTGILIDIGSLQDNCDKIVNDTDAFLAVLHMRNALYVPPYMNIKKGLDIGVWMWILEVNWGIHPPDCFIKN